MKRIKAVCLAALLLALFASPASAQMCVWTNACPKTGMVMGTISVAGKLQNLPCGWNATNMGAATVWPAGGGVVKTIPLMVLNGVAALQPIGGLTSGVNYNVTLNLVAKDPCGVGQDVASDTVQAVAK